MLKESHFGNSSFSSSAQIMFYCILQLLAFAIVLGRPTIMQINLKIMILTIVKVIAVIK